MIRYAPDFSFWIGTGSNPVDIIQFRSHTGNYILPVTLGGDELEPEAEVDRVGVLSTGVV